jgi:hypothetical protein
MYKGVLKELVTRAMERFALKKGLIINGDKEGGGASW